MPAGVIFIQTDTGSICVPLVTSGHFQIPHIRNNKEEENGYKLINGERVRGMGDFTVCQGSSQRNCQQGLLYSDTEGVTHGCNPKGTSLLK